ncbi:MAG: phage portal protein [Sphingomonadales bacterium]
MQLVDRIFSAIGFERRSAASSTSWAAIGSALGTAPAVSERMAENFATVTACVNAVSSALAMAPAYIYRRTDGERVEVVNHPLRRLIDGGPNSTQTWPDLIEAHAASTLLSGNGLIEIQRDGAEIVGLRHIPWAWVSPMLAPSGRLVYDVTEQTGLYGSQGRTRRLLSDDVIHLRDRSDDGILGRSRLSRSPATISSALQGNEFAQAFLANGAQPSGAIESDAAIAPDKMSALRAQFDEGHAGTSKAGKVLVLSDGLKFVPFQISPEDAELLGSRKFSVEEVCRLFQVPPPLVQDYSHNTFTNSEAAGRWFAQFTLGPMARKIEAAFSRALFPEGSGLEIELDLSSFLRGDPQTRWAAHKIAVEAGILDPDEVREIEGFNPRQRTPQAVAQ